MQENWKSERQEKKAAKAAKRKAKQSKNANAESPTGPAAGSPDLQIARLAPRPPGVQLSPVASVEVVYQPGVAGTGQPYVEYPQLNFEPFALFVLGSPVGMFLTVRWAPCCIKRDACLTWLRILGFFSYLFLCFLLSLRSRTSTQCVACEPRRISRLVSCRRKYLSADWNKTGNPSGLAGYAVFCLFSFQSSLVHNPVLCTSLLITVLTPVYSFFWPAFDFLINLSFGFYVALSCWMRFLPSRSCCSAKRTGPAAFFLRFFPVLC